MTRGSTWRPSTFKSQKEMTCPTMTSRAPTTNRRCRRPPGPSREFPCWWKSWPRSRSWSRRQIPTKTTLSRIPPTFAGTAQTWSSAAMSWTTSRRRRRRWPGQTYFRPALSRCWGISGVRSGSCLFLLPPAAWLSFSSSLRSTWCRRSYVRVADTSTPADVICFWVRCWSSDFSSVALLQWSTH